MTLELAPGRPRLADVEMGSHPSLLARRLDRLRHGGTAADGARPIASTSVAAVRAVRAVRAERLARDLAGELQSGEHGAVVVIERTVALPLARDLLQSLPWAVDRESPIVCLDLETTGLGTAAGTLPFLVGIGTWHGPSLTTTQLLLPDHADEPALLSLLAAIVPPEALLVTYNGRCFDWPLVVSRFRLHRRSPPAMAGHLDLLPIARLLWKHRLGDARLATVERICGVRRQNDLPGALVPERYFRYLRDGRADPLRDVLAHNRQDVLSLGLLLALMAERLGRREAWPSVHPGDLGGLARAYARRGRTSEALDCLEAALRTAEAGRTQPALSRGAATVRSRLGAERARLLARLGRRDEAVAAWLAIARAGGPAAATAWIHVARHREHVQKDAAGALEACGEAARIAQRSRAWGRPMPGVERDLRRRCERLQRRLGAVSRVDPFRPAA